MTRNSPKSDIKAAIAQSVIQIEGLNCVRQTEGATQNAIIRRKTFKASLRRNSIDGNSPQFSDHR